MPDATKVTLKAEVEQKNATSVSHWPMHQ